MSVYYTKNLAVHNYENIRFMVIADSMKEALILLRSYHIAEWKHWSIKGITQDLVKVLDYGRVKEFTYIE